MGGWFHNVVSSAVSIALIVALTRWLFSSKGAPLPTVRDGSSLYQIKWQLRAFSVVVVLFWSAVLLWSWHDLHHLDKVLVAMVVVFVLGSLWLASGSVSTNASGITKKVFWRSRFFRWSDITEVRMHKKRGEAIELRAGSEKIIIDSRFVAFQHLLNEIEDHTQLRAIEASS
jgi:hypothetical protein